MVASGEARFDGPERQAQQPFEERELAVMAELAREGEARVAFQGLRRRLDLHQESLSRTLRRLEQQGLVARDGQGYKLTDQGFASLRGQRTRPPAGEVLTVVQAVLPPHVGPDAVQGHLARRWFRGLRWYGSSEAPGELTLTWLTEPGGAKVRVRVQGGALTLETELPPGAHGHAFAAARAVLAAVAELYGLAAPQVAEASPAAGAFAAEPGYAA